MWGSFLFPICAFFQVTTFACHPVSIVDTRSCGLGDFCEVPETVKRYLLDCLKYQQYQEILLDLAMKKIILNALLSLY